jgi:hypothetical protein
MPKCVQILNSIGLAFGMLGVVILFVWSPPLADFEGGGGLLAEDGTVDAESGKTYGRLREEAAKRKIRYKYLSRIGLFFIFIGFAFQLWACWS